MKTLTLVCFLLINFTSVQAKEKTLSPEETKAFEETCKALTEMFINQKEDNIATLILTEKDA